ncbi:MAG: hypothetical protein ACOX1O_06405 [Eggerthellaceae bacterium]
MILRIGDCPDTRAKSRMRRVADGDSGQAEKGAVLMTGTDVPISESPSFLTEQTREMLRIFEERQQSLNPDEVQAHNRAFHDRMRNFYRETEANEFAERLHGVQVARDADASAAALRQEEDEAGEERKMKRYTYVFAPLAITGVSALPYLVNFAFAL